MEASFKVFVRFRPMPGPGSRGEFRLSEQTVRLTQVHVPKAQDSGFTFDQVFNESHSNFDVYTHSLKALVPALAEGYNLTYFAYGMTGAGKTHTMFGEAPAELGLA